MLQRGSRAKLARAVMSLGAVAALAAGASAQDVQTPKWDVFTGYQWAHPGGQTPSPFGTYDAPIANPLPDAPWGVGAAVTRNFNQYLGLEADYGKNWTTDGKGTNEMTVSGGPRLMLRAPGANFFLHTLLSWNQLGAPGLKQDNGIGAILGGGVDLPLTKLITIRLAEADYVWARHNYASLVSPEFPDLRRPSLEGVRLRTGLLWNFGYPPTATPAAACSVQQSEVMVGEPVTVNTKATNFNPKHTLTYNYTTNGGKVSGKEDTATIDTNGVAGGTYTVNSTVTDSKMKKMNTASCSATYTVKEPPKNPPTMSCKADPTSVKAGETSTVTCTCTSPDGVPVNVGDWTASSGTVTGNGSTATLNTTGASAGPITVSATCTDSRGLKSQATSTQVTVENPPPPPPPQASKLSQCDFPNEKKPWRVDNTCKAILDDVAKNLQQNADSKLVIVGNADPSEKRKNLAAERAVDSKYYLTSGEAQQGIDASRIETRTGTAGGKTAEFWIVPAGATYAGEGTTTVDEAKVKNVPDHPAKKAPMKKKKPAAQ